MGLIIKLYDKDNVIDQIIHLPDNSQIKFKRKGMCSDLPRLEVSFEDQDKADTFYELKGDVQVFSDQGLHLESVTVKTLMDKKL